jgi:hypothetical protein
VRFASFTVEFTKSCPRKKKPRSTAGLSRQNESPGRKEFGAARRPGLGLGARSERGVAMIHSYWFIYARRTFEGVLQQDPSYAIAYWGIALDFLGNSLATTPTRAEAEAGWAALEKAHAVGAKTQRERDWIETLSAYYRDHDKTPVNARLAAYNNAMEQLAQRYPDDYEAQVFYALTLLMNASASSGRPSLIEDASRLSQLANHSRNIHTICARWGHCRLLARNGRSMRAGECAAEITATRTQT